MSTVLFSVYMQLFAKRRARSCVAKHFRLHFHVLTQLCYFNTLLCATVDKWLTQLSGSCKSKRARHLVKNIFNLFTTLNNEKNRFTHAHAPLDDLHVRMVHHRSNTTFTFSNLFRSQCLPSEIVYTFSCQRLMQRNQGMTTNA